MRDIWRAITGKGGGDDPPDPASALESWVRAHARHDRFLWLGPDFEVTLFDGEFAFRRVPLTGPDGQQVPDRNVLVAADFACRDHDFRLFFTTLEFLIFQIVHYRLEMARPHYVLGGLKDEGSWERVKRLRRAGFIDREEKDALSRLFDVRNRFAHTVESLAHIPYRGRPLGESFDTPDEAGHAFLPDAVTATGILLTLYHPVMGLQVIRI